MSNPAAGTNGEMTGQQQGGVPFHVSELDGNLIVPFPDGDEFEWHATAGGGGYWERWVGDHWEILRFDEPSEGEWYRVELGVPGSMDHGTYQSH